jgi:hypothetical protein
MIGSSVSILAIVLLFSLASMHAEDCAQYLTYGDENLRACMAVAQSPGGDPGGKIAASCQAAYPRNQAWGQSTYKRCVDRQKPALNVPNNSYSVDTSDRTVASLPPPSLLDLSKAPSQDRQRLAPLYQREYTLLQELNAVKWQALHDTLGGLFVAGSAAIAASSGPSTLGEAAAARGGQSGARVDGVNAALDAQEPTEMYASVDRAMWLLSQIAATDAEISRVQKEYGIDPTMRPLWSSYFQKTKQLTPTEVIQLLAPAANRAAKEVGRP